MSSLCLSLLSPYVCSFFLLVSVYPSPGASFKNELDQHIEETVHVVPMIAGTRLDDSKSPTQHRVSKSGWFLVLKKSHFCASG